MSPFQFYGDKGNIWTDTIYKQKLNIPYTKNKQGFIQVFCEKASGQNWEIIIDKTPKLGSQFHLILCCFLDWLMPVESDLHPILA